MSNVQVIDLCDDEDERPVVSVEKMPAAGSVIELLDDESPVRGKENGEGTNSTTAQQHNDQKRAARPTMKLSPGSRKRLRAEQRMEARRRRRQVHVRWSKTTIVPASSIGNPPAAARLKDPPQAKPKDPPPAAKVIDVSQPGLQVLSPLQQVLEVFPDVDIHHAQNLLNTHGNPMTVVAILAESSYPKAKSNNRSNSTSLVHRDKRQRTYDFMSTSSFTASSIYIQEARNKLYQEFPFLSQNGVNKILKQASNHYAIAHNTVCKAIMNGGHVDSKDADRQEEQYRLLKSAMTGVPLSEEQHLRLVVGKRRTTVLHPRRQQKAVSISDSVLKEEIDYVKQKEAEWMGEVNMRLLRKQNRAAAEKAGETIECPCCCFDVAVDEMIACRDEGHLFCIDCVRRFAENQIFTLGSFGVDRKTGKPATDLLCMHGDGCSSGFHVEHLRKALPEKILAKYDELQFRAAASAAGIELFSCPKCGAQAEIPAGQMIFQCPVAECAQETCKLCKEPAHIPLKCSEVEKQHETKGRLTVEEAISQAKIRTCPKPGCGKKFIKEGTGCNKMTCSCGTFSCYICRALIPKNVGYKHFCQTPHCQHKSCNQCPLYSNVEEDDKRAMREAGFSAAEQVRATSLISASDTADGVAAALPAEVRVDVDSLLKEAPGAARAPKVARRYPH